VGGVFLSYSRQDRAYADRLAAFLRERGLPVWYDHEILPDRSFPAQLTEQIRSSSAVVVVLTEAANRSRWVDRETATADRFDVPMIALLLEDCAPPVTLATHTPVDVSGGSLPPAETVERLRQLCGIDADADAPVRSAYMAQIRQIAPPRLLGRENELAELTRFCLGQEPQAYAWWQAGPWAGKTALMSAFVLDPPGELAGQAKIVSFFITARLAAQDTRGAFTTVLTAQLCLLLGEELPVGVGEETREAALFDLMERAATSCRQAGKRLVFVVDGLDEDRGETIGPEARSIAGLLPSVPPAGMRIVIAGRPNPPIPDDVPDFHPLRDKRIIRELGASEHARDLYRLSTAELKRLLRGTEVEQEVLGLITAAGGGLTTADLRALTGARLVLIEDVLHTAAGRTFDRRPSTLDGERPELYLLGHEELQKAALHYLDEQLTGYRDRLLTWADSYRRPAGDRPAWPAETPEYLLTGYPRLLRYLDDAERLVELAADSVRHDRMLAITGGDAGALAEIRSGQDLLLDRPDPDLVGLARLAYHRAAVEARNDNLPTGLPAVWAMLGRPARAEALARGITDPDRQAEALARVAGSAAAAGLDAEAERIAHGITALGWRVSALVEVARGVDDRTAFERLMANAEEAARGMADVESRGAALAQVARGAVDAGDAVRAGRIAESIDDPGVRARALRGLPRLLAGAGQEERALEVAAGLPEPQRAAEVIEVAVVAARDGRDEHAEGLVVSLDDQDRAMIALAEAVAIRGAYARAERLAGRRAEALARIAVAAAERGDREVAERLMADAEDSDGSRRASSEAVLAALSHAAGLIGDADRAERYAELIRDRVIKVGALNRLALTLAAAGRHDAVRRVVLKSYGAAAHTVGTPEGTVVLRGLIRAAAAAGEMGLARRLPDAGDKEVRRRRSTRTRMQFRVELAQAAALEREHDFARQVVTEAERTARGLVDADRESEQAAVLSAAMITAGNFDLDGAALRGVKLTHLPEWALRDQARTIAAAGQPHRAELVAGAITDLNEQARAYTGLARAFAATGEYDRAERVARHFLDPDWQGSELAEVAETVAAAGDRIRAERIVGTIPVWRWRARAFTRVAEVVAMTDPHRAEQMARRSDDPLLQARALVAVVRAAAVSGHAEIAERLMAELENDLPRLAGLDRSRWLSADLAAAAAGLRNSLLTGGNPTVERLAARLEAAADNYEYSYTEPLTDVPAMPSAEISVLVSQARSAADQGSPKAAAAMIAEAERALAVAPSLGSLIAVVRTAAEIGDHEGAERIAAGAADPQALLELVRALVRIGRNDAALRIARRIAAPDQRAEALTAVAASPDTPDSARLYGEAFATGSWLIPLSALARTQPELVVRIAARTIAG
jgi:hypothetical protein